MRVRSHGDHRIAKNAEVGAAALTVNWVVGVRLAFVEMRQERRGQVATSGGAHYADAIWVDAPVGRASANKPQGAGGVLEHGGMTIAMRTQAVLKNKGGDAVLVKPFCVIRPFVWSKSAVTATRADNDRRTGRPFRQVSSQGRDVFVFFAKCTRRTAGPEPNGRLRVRSQDARNDQEATQ